MHDTLINPFVPTAPYEGALKLAKIAEKTRALMIYKKLYFCMVPYLQIFAPGAALCL